MSTKYKHSHEVPTAVLAKRLEELSDAVGKRGEERDRELTRRIPAELDRDADLVLMEASTRLLKMEAERDALAAQVEAMHQHFENREELHPATWAVRGMKLMQEGPTTSLARLQGTARAEAMEWAAEKASPSVAPWLKALARDYRRQAEESNQ